MSTALPKLPKAFAVPFAELEEWSVRSFFSIDWRWPEGHIQPLSAALRRKRERVDKDEHPFDTLQLITLHFDGSMEPRDVEGKKRFKGRLYFAEPGDVVYSKIDVRHGAIGVVPDEMGRVAVSSEYPVYTVHPEVALPRFVKLVFRMRQFRQLVNSMISGASGRKRVKPTQMERIEVPLPPLEVQRAIIERHRKAQSEARRLREQAETVEENIESDMAEALGLDPLCIGRLPRAFAVEWGALHRWDEEGTYLLEQIGDMAESPYPVVSGEAYLHSVRNGCSKTPSRTPTGLEVLKISAATRGQLDLGEKKHISDSEKLRERFDLKRGDVLICRTNGTLDYVGMSALIPRDLENFIFPDKLIRLRPKKAVIEPAYLWKVLQLPYLRVQVEAAARTAVGNYAIGGDDVWTFRIPLPPLDVQREIVAQAEEKRKEAARLRSEADAKERSAREAVEAMILGTRAVNEAPV